MFINPTLRNDPIYFQVDTDDTPWRKEKPFVKKKVLNHSLWNFDQNIFHIEMQWVS